MGSMWGRSLISNDGLGRAKFNIPKFKMDFSLLNHKNWCFRDKDTQDTDDHRMEYDIQFSDDSNSKTIFEAIINSKFGYTPFQEKLNTEMMDGFWTGFPQQALFVSHSARTLQDWSRTNWLQDSLEVKFWCVPSVSLHALLVYPYRMWFIARTWLYSTICLTSSIHLVYFPFYLGWWFQAAHILGVEATNHLPQWVPLSAGTWTPTERA